MLEGEYGNAKGGGKEMLRGGVIQRKTIGMFFHEGGSEFAQGGVRICAGGVLHLQKGGSEFGQGG